MTNELAVAGYASRFGVVDLGGDVVAPGAFSASLHRRPRPAMLWEHDGARVVGVWDAAREDDAGLWVEGRVRAGSAQARTAQALVRAGLVSGLSIGFRPKRVAMRADGVRVLEDVEVWEVSLTASPLLPQARLTRVGHGLTPLGEASLAAP